MKKAHAPWVLRRHEMLGDSFLRLCAEHGISPPPVLWVTSDDGLETKCVVLWDMDEDFSIVEGPQAMLSHLVFESVAARYLGDARN